MAKPEGAWCCTCEDTGEADRQHLSEQAEWEVNSVKQGFTHSHRLRNTRGVCTLFSHFFFWWFRVKGRLDCLSPHKAPHPVPGRLGKLGLKPSGLVCAWKVMALQASGVGNLQTPMTLAMRPRG